MPQNVPEQEDGQQQLAQLLYPSPWLASWWTTQNITNVPADAIGWLVSQGWRVTDIEYDETTVPPTPSFSLTRESLQNSAILQSLMERFQDKDNDALLNNTLRYNDVIESWSNMLGTSHDHFDNQVTEQQEHAALFLGNLETYMDEIDGLIDANQTAIAEGVAAGATTLGEMNTKLDELEDNVAASTVTIEALLVDQGDFLTTFLTDFAIKLTELDENYSQHLDTINNLLTSADTDLADFQTTQAAELAALESEYEDYADQLEALLAVSASNLSSVTTEVDAILDGLEAEYDALDSQVNGFLALGLSALADFEASYSLIVGGLEADYTEHASTATEFLTDLGDTELARINEQFAASLAAQLQQLTDRGLYSSAVAADITERNVRDRDEQIQALNDRLNREKFENQHQIYGQQVAMRQQTLAGLDRVHSVKQEVWRYQSATLTGQYQLLQSVRDRTIAGKQALHGIREANVRFNADIRGQVYASTAALRTFLTQEAARLQQLQLAVSQFNTGQRDRLLEQVQAIEAQHLAGLSTQHAAQQDISRVAMSERERLLTFLQDAVNGLISGKERHASLTVQHASTLAEHKHRAIVEKMNEANTRLAGLQGKHDESMRLMAYQLDERNKILIGLYGFVERRDDIPPSFESLVALATSLADAGGGWVTP